MWFGLHLWDCANMVWLVIGQDLWAIFVFALHDVSHHLQYRLWTVTLREGLKTNWLVLGLFLKQQFFFMIFLREKTVNVLRSFKSMGWVLAQFLGASYPFNLFSHHDMCRTTIFPSWSVPTSLDFLIMVAIAMVMTQFWCFASVLLVDNHSASGLGRQPMTKPTRLRIGTFALLWYVIL